jgi:MYXO-CTERM domain-containing protein
MMDDMPMGDDGPISRRTGCSTIPGGATGASAGAATLYLLGLVLARRRRRAA